MKFGKLWMLLLACLLLAGCGGTRGGGGSSYTAEICGDGIDNNADGSVDEGEDWDGDGFWTCGTDDRDCDDRNNLVHPAAGEACDGLDTNCDGFTPPDEADLDSDGCMLCEGDPDDNDPEVCDGGNDDDNNSGDGDGPVIVAMDANCDDLGYFELWTEVHHEDGVGAIVSVWVEVSYVLYDEFDEVILDYLGSVDLKYIADWQWGLVLPPGDVLFNCEFPYLYHFGFYAEDDEGDVTSAELIN